MCFRMKKIRAQLVGTKVIVWDIKDSRTLFSKGFYGKPLGIRKPKTPEDINSPLILSLIEALYLLEKGVIEIYGSEGEVDFNKLLAKCKEHVSRCIMLYNVYREFRERGFVVRSGLKFGADYAVYEKGPGIDHAPYLVHVLSLDEKTSPIELVRAGRLSHSVRKKFIVAATKSELGSEVTKIMFKWYRP